MPSRSDSEERAGPRGGRESAPPPVGVSSISLDQTSIAPDMVSMSGETGVDRTLRERSAMESILVYIMMQSYICSLIVMMVSSCYIYIICMYRQ